MKLFLFGFLMMPFFVFAVGLPVAPTAPLGDGKSYEYEGTPGGCYEGFRGNGVGSFDSVADCIAAVKAYYGSGVSSCGSNQFYEVDYRGNKWVKFDCIRSSNSTIIPNNRLSTNGGTVKETESSLYCPDDYYEERNTAGDVVNCYSIPALDAENDCGDKPQVLANGSLDGNNCTEFPDGSRCQYTPDNNGLYSLNYEYSCWANNNSLSTPDSDNLPPPNECTEYSDGQLVCDVGENHDLYCDNTSCDEGCMYVGDSQGNELLVCFTPDSNGDGRPDNDYDELPGLPDKGETGFGPGDGNGGGGGGDGDIVVDIDLDELLDSSAVESPSSYSLENQYADNIKGIEDLQNNEIFDNIENVSDNSDYGGIRNISDAFNSTTCKNYESSYYGFSLDICGAAKIINPFLYFAFALGSAWYCFTRVTSVLTEVQ